MERPVKKILRSPMPKKRSKIVPLSERVTLERVLGVTVKDDSALTCDPNTGLIAYPAGCVIVIFNPRNNKQYHIINQSKKTITALAFSSDGKNLVSGECGHNPAVRVWDVEERTQVAELLGHKFGVACVAFSPNLRYVVSIGEQHDMAVNVWNWKEGAKVASGKISNKVTGLCFSEDGGMFVTVGNRNVKFWYLSAKRKTRETLPLNGRSGILGEQRNNFFCSVACGQGRNANKTYCITKSGLLCEFNESRLLDKWVELRTLSAFCLTASEDHLFVGCADGVLRVFDSSTLHFVSTFPKPHFLGVNVSEGIDPSHMGTHQDNAKYPDTIALVHDDVNKKVTCIYNDHSVYVWDVHDLKKIGKHRSFLYHSSCIWGVEMYPKMLDSIREMLPTESFITCSSDDTIRIWNTDPAMTSDVFKRNIYSKELLKILYIDENYENILDVDYNPAGTSDKTDPGEGKNGVRCLCVSPDGQYLASGDRSGNVRVHDLQFMDELYCIEAHDSEVLCLEFTKPETGYNLLASASRDRLIHIFNMDEHCSLLQTLDDHSSSITAVKFSYTNDQLQMISCGADKALMFRTAVQTPDFQFVRNHHVVGKQTLYDITIDPTKKFVATACQDRNLRIHNTATGKLKRIYKGSLSDDGTLIKVELDPSGMYVATSCSDKTLAVFDFYSGECVATMTGHSELVTGIKFSNDCKHLISASGDGCIFLWQLPWGITHNIKERLAEMGQVKRRQQQQQYDIVRRGTYVVPKDMPLRMRTQIQAASQSTRNNNNNTEGQAEEEEMEETDFASATEHLQAQLETHAKRESVVPEDYRFSMGQLPLWAKKQVSGENIPSPTTYSSPSQPKGRWAQRIDGKGIKVKSEWENTIEVRLEDCLDRRRYTVEPDALLDQDFPVSEEEFQASVEAEFVSAEEGLKTFERELSEEEIQRLATSFVTSTRGSDPFLPPSRSLSDPKSTSPVTSQEDGQETSQDDEEEEEEEVVVEESSSAKEDDSKEEDIIYPPSEETPSSPESYEITASTKSLEEFVKRKQSFRQKSFRQKSIQAKSDTGSTDSVSSEKKTTDESSEATSHDPEITDPTSISTDEEEEIEDDSLEEEEEEDSLPSTTGSKGDNTEETTDDEAFLHTNFNFLEKEKFGKCLEQLQSGFSDDIATGRLSISSKFLSRSQLSQPRGPVVGVHGLSAASGGISAEQYLLRRKQEMAMAVDKTRRRLQMLGWKVSDSGKKLVSASSLDSLSKPQESQKSLTPVNKVKPQVRSQASSPVNKVGACTETARSSTSSKDSDDKELDRADSLEDMLDPKPVTKASSSPDVSSTSQPSSTHSPVTSKSSNGRTPPAVAPKPKKRTKNTKNIVEESKVVSSSSGDEVSTRSEDSLISKEDPKPKSLSPESLSFASSTKSSSPDSETVVAKPRKKELPQVPLKATGLEVSPQKLEEIKMEQDDSVFADNKENSRYSPAEARRGSCGASKAKINKLKNKKDTEKAMRRAASLSDIGTEDDKNSPSSHAMTLRSRSSERPAAAIKSVPNSPAREKRRATKNDRIVPLLPNQQQKLRSYEIGTKSSRAKVHPKADTPPASPHRYKKKRSLLNELKDIKNKQDNVKDKVDTITTNDKNKEKTIESSVPTGIVKPVEITNKTCEIKSDPASHISIDSLETEDKTKVLELKSPESDSVEIKSLNSDTIELKSEKSEIIELQSVKSDSTETKSGSTETKSEKSSDTSSSKSNKSETSQKSDSKSQNLAPTQNSDSKSKSQKLDLSSMSKEEADRLLMPPPPVSRKVPRTRTANKAVNEPKQVKKTTVESKKTSANKCAKSTELSSESDKSASDISPREEEKEFSPMSDISPISDVSSSPPSINGHDIAFNGHDDAKNGHDDSVINEQAEDLSETTVSVTGNDADGEQTVSVGTPGSPLSSTCDSIPDDILTESATEISECADIPTIDKPPIEAVRRKMSLDLPTAPKEPSPSADIVTPEELRTGVNDMKKAFENCMSLFNKATSPDTPDITKGHQMLDYLSSTLNSMQVSVAKLQSQRRQFYTSTSEESILSACNTCSSQIQERSRASSMGFLASSRKPSSTLSHSDLSELKVTLAKTKSPGNGKSRESDTEAASAIVLLDRYSELLVSMVRDKIVEENMIPSRSSSGSSYATDV